MGRKVNKVVRIGLGGGLIGSLLTNTKSAFEKEINHQNTDGWNLCELEAIGGANLFMMIVRMIILALTLGLFTLGQNYIMIFEKEG